MGDTNSIGCGIVGAGFMGQTYARVIDSMIDGAYVAAVACGSRAGELAGEYDAAHADDLEALLARDDVQFVCIGTPHSLHAEQAIAAANAGKHILIDKPMATTVKDCDAIISACEANNVRCEITYSQRERVCNVETKRILDSGSIGRMRHMHNVQVVPNGMETTPKWQLEPENVGILIGHTIHNIDQVRWFSGQEVLKVFAKVGAFNEKYKVDSTCDLILTLEDGTVCTIFSSFEVPAPGIPRTGGATQIIGERGIIDSDWYGELRVSTNGGDWEVVAKQPPIDWAGKGFLDPIRLETYTAVVQRIIDGVRAGDTQSRTEWDGRQAVAIAAAAYESSRTGKEIGLPVAR